MKAYLVPVYLLIVLLIGSCDEENFFPENLDGTYEGTFVRSTPQARYLYSNVTLTFANVQFEGSSDTDKYPAICRGSFSVDGNRVTFIDSCVWTAEFDCSLILSGEFVGEMQDDELVLTRYFDGFTDTYRLKLQ